MLPSAPPCRVQAQNEQQGHAWSNDAAGQEQLTVTASQNMCQKQDGPQIIDQALTHGSWARPKSEPAQAASTAFAMSSKAGSDNQIWLLFC